MNKKELKIWLNEHPDLIYYDRENNKYEDRKFVSHKTGTIYFSKNNGEITSISIRNNEVTYLYDGFNVHIKNKYGQALSIIVYKYNVGGKKNSR